MKPSHGLCLLLANMAAFATLSAAASAPASSGDSPCTGVSAPGADEPPRLPLEEEADEAADAKGGGDHGEPAKRVGFNAWGGKRVGFNAWGGKRSADADGSSAFRGGALGWVLGLRDGLRGPGGASGSPEEANKRVGFNAWGGKRSRFNAWGGKRGPKGEAPRAFFPWGGKRSGGEAEVEEGPRGSVEWLYAGQPEEFVGVREGSEGESGEAWGRPFGRGRRSPTSTRNHLIATVEDPTITEGLPWEHKRWNALWRAATNLQPPRQNRRAAGADFFPWGGKRSSL
ncbi:uncharacterized protein LOC124160758 [Ischnura elegans]|uniref:uncharacterized protein LOC124160758 n=1 Tax=Ischnura elegans TaxID=197161 RepID=UPI001ED86968|nr:uncharacterized protein LOC124160758 [Ischnura elegans]